ncbi:MAG: C39 family peptidase [Thermodesulfovibrionales bacterium]|nr:C39 family peptidase [Thermodesulfovibrionales bacterium]
MKRFNIIFFIFFLFYSCSINHSTYLKEIKNINNIPFFSQKEHQCGPSSLASILGFYGLTVTPEEIAGEIFSSSAKGTLTIDMLYYVNKRGFTAKSYSGNLTDLISHIDKGIPLIVLVDYGFMSYEQKHFMIIKGYNERGVIAISGNEENHFIDYKRFSKIWQKTNNWTLLVTKE